MRTIYQQPSAEEVHSQLEKVVEQLSDRFPQASSMLAEDGADVLASGFPGVEAGVVQQSPGASNQAAADVVGTKSGSTSSSISE